MKKLINYIIKNILYFIKNILLSIAFVFLILPIFTNLGFVKVILKETSKEIFIGITSVILFFLICSWGQAKKLWQRCKNTYRLKEPPFIFPYHIVFFIIFSVLLVLIFQRKIFCNISSEFKIFFVFNSLLLIIWFLTSYFYKEKNEKEDIKIEKQLLSDEPIQDEEQDLLNRKKFVDDLYKEITNLSFDDSFVFGLYGSWGEGKTSVINLLINKFKKVDNFLVINFDPWYFSNKDAILFAFYKQIEQSINKKFVFFGIKNIFLKYLNVTSFGLAQIGIKIDFSHKKETIDEIKQKIQSYITQTNNKLLIIIDDIDRLNSDEILFILKLVRLNIKFKNTIFLLSFDENYVVNVLKKELGPDSMSYIDKIIQKPIRLPVIEQNVLDEFLFTHIDKFLKEINISEENIRKFQSDFNYIYNTQIRKLFKNLRHIKRYLNGIRTTLPPIKNEINLLDFFIIEVIRIFYPRVYNDIWRNPWFYIPMEWSDLTSSLSPFSSSPFKEEKYNYIREHIENIIKDEKDNDVLKELLETIFFVEVKNALSESKTDHSRVSGTYRTQKRITHPECFRKYFTLKVPLEEISDEYLETILKSWNSTEENRREEIIENTIFTIQEKGLLLEFFKKLMIFMDKIQKEIVPQLIRVIYKNANKFSKEGSENLWNSEYDKSINLILWLINEKIGRDEIQNILEEIITNTPSLHFAVLLVLLCKKEIDGGTLNIYEIIKNEELQNKLSERLKKYFIDEKRDIFNELKSDDELALVLYQWATNWMTHKGNNNKIVNDYVLSLIKNDVRKFIRFLKLQIVKTFNKHKTFNLEEIKKIYNLEELQRLAEKFKNNNDLSKEDKEILELFLRLNDKNKGN